MLVQRFSRFHGDNSCVRFVSVFTVLVLVFLVCPAVMIGQTSGNTPDPTPTPTPEATPSSDTEQGNWLDKIHKKTGMFVQGQVTNADTLFVKDSQEALAIKNSTFQLGIYIRGREEDGKTRIKFDPEFDADLELPNMEHRLKVFVSGRELDELPGTGPHEDENSLSLGLKKTFKYLDTRIGIKGDWPPVVFADAVLRHRFAFSNGSFTPKQKVYYRTDDGFGEVTTFQLDYWFHEKFLTRWDTGVKWTEETIGVEWEESMTFGYILDGDLNHLKKAMGIRYSVFGHKTGRFLIDRHRISTMYRFPIYKDWMYFKIIPSVPSHQVHSGDD